MKQVSLKFALAVMASFVCCTIHSEIIQSGTYGDNISWTLDDSYQLTIDGKGEMQQNMYEYGGEITTIPWRKIKDIKKIVINEGLTSISPYSFYGMSNVESISLPQSMVKIGSHAFTDCSSLSTINIPSDVMEFGDGVFFNDISLPVKDGLRYAGNYLVSVEGTLPEIWEIPEGTEYIGEYVLQSGHFSSFAKTCDISKLKKVVLPSSLRMICSYAFYESMGNWSVEVKSPSALRSIESYAFRDSWQENEEGYVMLGNVFCGYGGTYPNSEVFEVPEGCVSIAGHAFFNTKYKKIILPNSLTTISDFSFGYSSNLEELTIPCNVKYIGRESFYCCSKSLKSIVVEEGNPVFDSRNNCNALINTKDSTLILGCRNTQIPDGVTCLAEQCFRDCQGMETLTIPSHIKTIGGNAFYGTSIKQITIPSTVSNYGYGIFDQSSLESVTFDYGWTNIPCFFWYCKSLTYVNLPSTVKTIEGGAFAECWGLRNIVLPRNLTDIGMFAFSGCKLDSLTCLAKEVPNIELDENSGSQISSLSTILVPEESVDKYKAAEFWKDYNIVGIKVKDVSSVLVDKSSLSINIGDTCQLSASVFPVDAYNTNIVWLSEDKSIAEVDKNGVVNAISKGTVTITAIAEDGSNVCSTCSVTVNDPSADTDISSYANVIYIGAAEAKTGATTTLSLKMNNVVSVTGFQCDVYTPTGTSIEKDDDFYLIDLSTERTSARKTDYFNTAGQADGSVRVLCSSTKSYAFEGNEGEVATIDLSVGAEMADGEYPLILKNIVITDNTGKTYKVDYVKTTLTVTSYTLGDANGDGDINVGDFTSIANHIMGSTPANFVMKAADVNEDKEINVGDLTCVANLILYGSVTPKSAAKSIDNNAVVNEISITDAVMNLDRTVEISIAVENGMALTGFQFDMEMPEGFALVSDDVALSNVRTSSNNTDIFTSKQMSDGTVRVLCGSSKVATFEGNNGEVVTAKLSVDDTIASGDYTVTLKNIILSDADGNAYKVNEAKAVISVCDVTEVKSIEADTMKNAKIFSANGVEQNSLKSGLNIIKHEDGTITKIMIK